MYDYWAGMADECTADDWTRGRSDLELAELLAEHRLEIAQQGWGEVTLEHSDEVLEYIGEVRRRAALARETRCVAAAPVPWMPSAEVYGCEPGSRPWADG